ncbi:hypothetical protein PHYSODRAFT_312312 [Phytophthora sojae]|uniref:Uncharacterized protein n=1 Tax=Phytophthora sojae (strain P6497) TaxID=1094619 RepID=G4YY61_PHYSP|nr:hypothetical protein PHYSODRAFT_312312 [Phytophthora sojae]EGZ26229.1 hypothetical protein PHYSODRAFT_312312 [Phytophthora sojae]|eukprot:XP_009521517.1 hypothetical protein PHYSODRAFT_312312 [Phytophthora sojae]
MALEKNDASGWHDVEQTLTALELPPVPPTSDPQRLLGYVLHILPRYTEMEMLATHLRLYASTLEQDMEQVKGHVRLLNREAASEREKKQFLERYAAQVVKERNDLLHSRGSSKKRATAAAASHFVWHNCCKKNTSHAMDLAPSILAFRGEKLQEATKQAEALQEEVHNQELLRKELDFLLKKTQREHDSKVAADRKHIQQLEKQIQQRSALHSSLERKLYEVESALARHDKTKDEELGLVSDRIREAQAHIASLEKENASLLERVNSLSLDRERLTELLEETTESKDVFADQIDELSEKCQSLESEVEALRSEIDMLQTKDINDIRTQYATRIDRLQQDNAANEQRLRREIDRLKQELKKRDEALAQTFSARQSTTRGGSTRPLSGHTSGLESNSVSGDDAKWSDGIFDDDRQFESDALGSSLSRSQLSVSQGSYGFSSSAGQSHFNLSKEVGAANRSRSPHGDKPRRSYSSSTRRSEAMALDAVSRDLSTSSRELGTELRENHASAIANTNDEPFDWETFIDSASEISILHDEHAKLPASATPRPMDLSTSTIRHESSMARLSDPGFSGSSRASEEGKFEDEQREEKSSLHSSHTINGASFSKPQSFDELDLEFAEHEKEKEADKDTSLGNREQSQREGDDTAKDATLEQEQQYEVHGDENATAEKHVGDLARDLYEMLNGLEQKRKEEEQKASQAEQALLEFLRLQQGVQTLQISPDS